MISRFASEDDESEALEAETCSAELLTRRSRFGITPFQRHFTLASLEFHDSLIADLSDDLVQGELACV